MTRLVGTGAGRQELSVTRAVGSGGPAFARARAALLGWDVMRVAGLGISPATPPVAEGVVVDQVLGLGRLGLLARCRVVAVVDEPRRAGFTYRTLTPHPEEGEETFTLDLGEDDVLRLTVASHSRLVSPLARLVPVVARTVQGVMVRRYLRAARQLAR